MSTARFRIALGVILLVAVAAGMAQAQEFRGRVQGHRDRRDRRRHAGAWASCSGTTTPASNPAGRRTSDGRYLFDYVDPGTYTLTAELTGFKTAIQQERPSSQQRGDVTVDVKLEVGTLVETRHA